MAAPGLAVLVVGASGAVDEREGAVAEGDLQVVAFSGGALQRIDGDRLYRVSRRSGSRVSRCPPRATRYTVAPEALISPMRGRWPTCWAAGCRRIHRPGPGGECGRRHPGLGRTSSGNCALHRTPVGCDPLGGGGVAAASAQRPQHGAPCQHVSPTQRRGSPAPLLSSALGDAAPPAWLCLIVRRLPARTQEPASLGATAAPGSGLRAGDEPVYVGT